VLKGCCEGDTCTCVLPIMRGHISSTNALPQPLCLCCATYRVLVQAPPGAAEGSRSVSLTERFYCRPSDLFESLTDERRIRAYTQVIS